MSRTVDKTSTNSGIRNKYPLMTQLPTSAEAISNEFSFPSIKLALEKYLTQKAPDRHHPQWSEFVQPTHS